MCMSINRWIRVRSIRSPKCFEYKALKSGFIKLNFILRTSRVFCAASFFQTINCIWLKETSRKTYSIPFIIVTRGQFVQFLTRGHDFRHNDTQHDGTQHKGQNCNAEWNVLCYAECSYFGCYYILLKKPCCPE